MRVPLPFRHSSPLGVGFVHVPPAHGTVGAGGGEGGGTVLVRPRSHFISPFVRASSLLGPLFPVLGVSLSACAPCGSLIR